LYTLSTLGILTSIGFFLYPTFINVMLHVDKDISSYLMTLCYQHISLALLLGSLGAIFLGYFIAKRSLKRIDELAEKMQEITATSLHNRINPHEWPKELQLVGEKFNDMLNRLERSFQQLSQFSSDIAHELRNPLHNLKVITEIALNNEKSVQEYQGILESNQEEYAYLTRLIENLLFLAQSDHGQMLLNKESFAAHTEINKVCDFYQALAEEKNISIQHSGEAEILADRTLFKRILNNLLANSLKYTTENGRINVAVNNIDNFHVQLSVKDTGIGIAKEHLPHIFDRFYRVDPSRSSQSGGLGLGLAIVKSIVLLHKGTIEIQSQPSIGTTILVSLPNG